jgi:hypothetical protein
MSGYESAYKSTHQARLVWWSSLLPFRETPWLFSSKLLNTSTVQRALKKGYSLNRCQGRPNGVQSWFLAQFDYKFFVSLEIVRCFRWSGKIRPEIWEDIHSRTNHNWFLYITRPRNQLFDSNAYFRAIVLQNPIPFVLVSRGTEEFWWKWRYHTSLYEFLNSYTSLKLELIAVALRYRDLRRHLYRRLIRHVRVT